MGEIEHEAGDVVVNEVQKGDEMLCCDCAVVTIALHRRGACVFNLISNSSSHSHRKCLPIVVKNPVRVYSS
jgi:hypothetical protein